jgi:hypothetical protein
VPQRGAGPSKVKVSGPCGFDHTGEADCEADGDDFYVMVTRKTKSGAEVMLFVNVERFVGPGRYKAPNDIFVSLMDGNKIYRWWSNQSEVVVGAGSRYVTFTKTQLERNWCSSAAPVRRPTTSAMAVAKSRSTCRR